MCVYVCVCVCVCVCVFEGEGGGIFKNKLKNKKQSFANIMASLLNL